MAHICADGAICEKAAISIGEIFQCKNGLLLEIYEAYIRKTFWTKSMILEKRMTFCFSLFNMFESFSVDAHTWKYVTVSSSPHYCNLLLLCKSSKKWILWFLFKLWVLPIIRKEWKKHWKYLRVSQNICCEVQAYNLGYRGLINIDDFFLIVQLILHKLRTTLNIFQVF